MRITAEIAHVIEDPEGDAVAGFCNFIQEIYVCTKTDVIAFGKPFCCSRVFLQLLIFLPYINIKWHPNIIKMINQIISNNIKPIFMNICSF